MQKIFIVTYLNIIFDLELKSLNSIHITIEGRKRSIGDIM